MLTPGVRFPERLVEPRDPTLRNRKHVWSRPEGSSDSNSSDEASSVGGVCPLAVVAPEEEEYEEVPLAPVSEDGSDCGDAPTYGEEQEELTEEEDSDSVSEGEDDVIYMGRSSATVALRQSLLSQFFKAT